MCCLVGVILKHIVDSCACIPYIKENARVCDIGCGGGGFPTLIIGALRPDVTVLGVDSVTKKVNYVLDTARMLGFDGVSVSNRRAEELGQDLSFREGFDVLTARAVGKLNLISYLADESKTIDDYEKIVPSFIRLLYRICVRKI